jgi:hypothetical protein
MRLGGEFFSAMVLGGHRSHDLEAPHLRKYHAISKITSYDENNACSAKNKALKAYRAKVSRSTVNLEASAVTFSPSLYSPTAFWTAISRFLRAVTPLPPIRTKICTFS